MMALGLKALESPPPRHSIPVPPRPTRVVLDDVLTALSALPRPRGRKLTAGETWGRVGRKGEEKGEEEEKQLEEEIVDDGLDALDESSARAAESEDVEGVDQEVEDLLLEDLPPRRRQ